MDKVVTTETLPRIMHGKTPVAIVSVGRSRTTAQVVPIARKGAHPETVPLRAMYLKRDKSPDTYLDELSETALDALVKKEAHQPQPKRHPLSR